MLEREVQCISSLLIYWMAHHKMCGLFRSELVPAIVSLHNYEKQRRLSARKVCVATENCPISDMWFISCCFNPTNFYFYLVNSLYMPFYKWSICAHRPSHACENNIFSTTFCITPPVRVTHEVGTAKFHKRNVTVINLIWIPYKIFVLAECMRCRWAHDETVTKTATGQRPLVSLTMRSPIIVILSENKFCVFFSALRELLLLLRMWNNIQLSRFAYIILRLVTISEKERALFHPDTLFGPIINGSGILPRFFSALCNAHSSWMPVNNKKIILFSLFNLNGIAFELNYQNFWAKAPVWELVLILVQSRVPRFDQRLKSCRFFFIPRLGKEQKNACAQD